MRERDFVRRRPGEDADAVPPGFFGGFAFLLITVGSAAGALPPTPHGLLKKAGENFTFALFQLFRQSAAPGLPEPFSSEGFHFL